MLVARRCDSLTQDVQDRDRRIAGLQEALAQERAEVEALERALQERSRSAEDAQRERDALSGRVQGLEASLRDARAAAEEAVAQATRDRQRARDEAEAAEARHAREMERSAEQAALRVQALQGELEMREMALEEARRELREEKEAGAERVKSRLAEAAAALQEQRREADRRIQGESWGWAWPGRRVAAAATMTHPRCVRVPLQS